MKKSIHINKKINVYKNKSIKVSGDKSLSIRFAILASLAEGKSKAKNLLNSEDVISTLNCLKKLGVTIKYNKKFCEITGKGLAGFNNKKNLILNAGNSGTAARLLMAALVRTKNTIKITGDNSLKKRDMGRIVEPLKKFGVKFPKNKKNLPILIKGSDFLKPIIYNELRGSAQCKSAVMIAALSTKGKTKLRCVSSRNHSELMFKNVLKVPIKIKKKKKFEIIELTGGSNFKCFNYDIPGDISSASFFIVLTLLSQNSNLLIKNININPTRTGIISILKMMGAKIVFKNIKIYRGEKIADIFVKNIRKLKSIKLDPKFNSSAIDEFLLLFLVASVSKGISEFKNLQELNKKESRRLDWGFKILTMMGIKTKKIGNHGIKIWGNPGLKLDKSFEIKNYLKDHRVFMVSVIAALSFGGNWNIYDPISVKTSFPTFLKITKELGGKIN
jgi:3-phosphoshikimate 1-carboxyvinyltransferase